MDRLTLGSRLEDIDVSGLKDWRGTPIEVGSKVIWHGESSYRTGIGVVTDVDRRHVRVYWREHKAHDIRISRPLDISRVTVLTKDMLDD